MNLPSTIGVSKLGYSKGIAISLKIFRTIPSKISQIIILPSKSALKIIFSLLGWGSIIWISLLKGILPKVEIINLEIITLYEIKLEYDKIYKNILILN